MEGSQASRRYYSAQSCAQTQVRSTLIWLAGRDQAQDQRLYVLSETRQYHTKLPAATEKFQMENPNNTMHDLAIEPGTQHNSSYTYVIDIFLSISLRIRQNLFIHHFWSHDALPLRIITVRFFVDLLRGDQGHKKQWCQLAQNVPLGPTLNPPRTNSRSR